MKITAFILILALAVSVAGCGAEQEPGILASGGVLISIPDTVSMCDPNGDPVVTIRYEFEKGWAAKETFACTHGGDADKVGQKGAVTTYADKQVITEIPNMQRIELRYDDQGRITSQVTYPYNNKNLTKTEIIYAYDDLGRIAAQSENTLWADAAEPEVVVRHFTYTETDTGSLGVSQLGGMTTQMHYDGNGRLVKTVTEVDGQEMQRTEYDYDRQGNRIRMVQYSGGNRVLEQKYTFRQVRVSEETAARMPQCRK